MKSTRAQEGWREIGFVCILMFLLLFGTSSAAATGACGTGAWTAGNLEIHHINIGQGDATLIVGPTGKSLLFDTGESYWNSTADAQVVGPYIEAVLGCKSLDYVVISHFHVDHIGYVGYGGLWNLVETQGFTVGTTLVRDYNTHLGNVSGTFTNWKTYLEGSGQAKLHPIWAVEGTSQVNLGSGVTFNIIAVNGNGTLMAGDFSDHSSPPSENDYSIGAVLSYGNFDEWIGGDISGQYEIGAFGYTYHDIELSVAPEVGDVDVYKVNHHGSSHSSSATFINQLDPEVSIVTVGNGNTHGHPAQTIINRLLATSTVYLTERGDTNTNIGSAVVAGHVVIKTSNGSTYSVNSTTYTATEPTRADTDGDGYFVEADPNDSNSNVTPAPNGGCGSNYQTCSVSSLSCQVSPGQVVINEVLPAPLNNGFEWVELYNTTASSINIGYCVIDDIVGGSAPYQIPASTIIPAHGFWTLDRTSYFNNAGDDVRFLKQDGATVVDSFSYGSTAYDVSWYRNPDGGGWAGSPTSSPTKGLPNSNSPPPTYTLTINIAGTGSGTVTGSGINCPGDCSEVYASGTLITLTPSAAAGSTFTGWSGASCVGSGICTITMTAATSITASFTQTTSTTFEDVPSHYWAWNFMERLYEAGITGGCVLNPPQYCPENTVTRAQMAVFLERGIHDSNYSPPAVGGNTGFDDVAADYWSAAWIKQLAADGITGGCGVGTYCPEAPVTRAQMAVFLLRSKYGAAYTPPAVGSSTGFSDVPPTYWAGAWIKQLVAEGITSGCGTNTYCPEAPVIRAQMAVFLVRTFNLP